MGTNSGPKKRAIPGSTLCVENALRKYKEGSSKDFDNLMSSIADPNIPDEELVDYLQQFKECITVLNKEFEIVVGVILKVDWLSRGDRVQVVYQSLITNLLSAHTVYLRACLRMVVKHFMPYVEGEVSDETRKVHEQHFYYLHGLLQRTVKMVPMTPTVLLPLLSEYFPFMTKSSYLHEVYVKNLLQITTYLPRERAKILTIIIDRMTKIDVRAPRADIEKQEEEDSDNEEENDDVQFDMDDVDAMESRVEDLQLGPSADSKDPAEPPCEPMTHADADRLDVMMDVLFRFIHTICHPDGKLDWVACKKLYLELLSVFDKIILPTHALCHTQFLLFFICSFREELTMGFIDFLWKKVSTPLTQVIFRQTAISYIASLLARAKYINLSVVQTTLEVILEWVHKYVQEAAFTSTKAAVSHHGTFYAVCQAVLYILVFRHKELLSTPQGHKYVQKLNLQTVVTSRLNPLKFCLPIIVKTFSSVMRQHQLLFCDTVIERNRRSVLSVEGNAALDNVNPLDSFFPFDPYLLSRSGRFVKDMYQEYEGTPAASDDTRKETEEDIEHQMEAESFATTPSGSAFPMSPTANPDFLMYGTSPGFLGT